MLMTDNACVIDGGGIRGLSTLYILQALMLSINLERQAKGLPNAKPCEVFDLIGGTSTGGHVSPHPTRRYRCELTRVCALRLIAIMLGRLEMSVESCIAAYTNLMESVFGGRSSPVDWSLNVKGRYSSQALETAIKSLIPEHEGPDTALLNDERSERRACRAYVASHLFDGSLLKRQLCVRHSKEQHVTNQTSQLRMRCSYE